MPSKDFVVTVSPRYNGSKSKKNPAINDLQLCSLLLIGILAITIILIKKKITFVDPSTSVVAGFSICTKAALS